MVFNWSRVNLTKHLTIASRLTNFKKNFQMTLHNCEFPTLKDMANKIGVQWQAGEYMLREMGKCFS